MADLHFELVTPERLVRSESVYMVVVPGTEGDFGVLAGHAPYMSTLRNGDLAIYRASMAETPERIPVEGGFAEVNEKGLTVLAERADADAESAARPAHGRAPEGVGPA
ncbi:MAG TPA: ATP synthase F1 subunit epsilon [Allosphingosinicella sp.]|jgi:F-type H+-transporting ATPase subunit epsilon